MQDVVDGLSRAFNLKVEASSVVPFPCRFRQIAVFSERAARKWSLSAFKVGFNLMKILFHFQDLFIRKRMWTKTKQKI